MAAPVVKMVTFRDGVYLHGVVAQSVGVGSGAVPQNSVSAGGLRLVERIVLESGLPGVIVYMAGRKFLVPWSSISSLELEPDEPEAKQPFKK